MSFKKPNPKQNFFELEQAILKWWKENQILEKSIEQRPDDQVKTFYDGPITANGEPHHGHMLTFAMKDIIPRYWSMKGYKVSRSLGWDCQGIPVEYEIEKKLGFQEKSDIEKYGIAEFNELCRKSVLEHKGAIVELEELMGRLTNDEEEYHTMDAKFIESIWWSLKELYEKDLLYEGFKVVPYSTRAGTTLSNAEVALGGYKPFIDPAITVKFQLKEEKDTYILAWTTTPWTIPSNLGLAVNKKIKYVKVKQGEEFYILAEKLVEDVMKEKEYEVVEEVSADDLVGKEYNPPFNFYVGRKSAHQVFAADYVSTDSGTGIVHLAPYGAEDNEVFQEVGIESFDVLNDQGDFTEEIEPYAGMFYRKANKYIIEDLKKVNRLWSHEEYEHDMPMCWRTKTPLIYKPITSWYIAMSSLREQLVETNNKIGWVPGHVKEGRFGNWLAEIKDWGISRKRYWGTPLPIWKSASGKVKIIGSFEELENLSGVKLEDPHRPYVDEIEFEIEGEKYTRIPDVIDVWYDSGAMPFARFHYPFENKDKFDKKFPADYISESVDQTRGWFYSLHAIGNAVFGSQAFNNVVMSGFVTDDKGQKLSKSKGNYTSPVPMVEQNGADSIRLNFYSTPISAGEDTNIDNRTIRLQRQETIIPLWNIYSYLTTYANIHKWKPSEGLVYNQRNVTTDEHPWNHIPFDDIDNDLDAWIVLRLQQTIKKVNEELGIYMISKAVEAIKSLIEDISKWYIRSSRDRFVNGDKIALETLYYVLVETIKLMAPFTPFITEHIYKELVVEHLEDQVESIHLTDFPEADQKFLDEYGKLDAEMAVVRKIAEIGHVLRTAEGLKVRQPLANLFYESKNKTVPVLTEWMSELLMKELNVLNVHEKYPLNETGTVKVQEDTNLEVKVGLDTEMTEDLQQRGIVREIVRQVQSQRKNMGMNMGDSVKLYYEGDEKVVALFERFKSEITEGVTASAIERGIIEKPMIVVESDEYRIELELEK